MAVGYMYDEYMEFNFTYLRFIVRCHTSLLETDEHNIQQTAKTQRSNHGIYAQYLVSNNNATLNPNSYEHIARNVHVPNTHAEHDIHIFSYLRFDNANRQRNG